MTGLSKVLSLLVRGLWKSLLIHEMLIDFQANLALNRPSHNCPNFCPIICALYHLNEVETYASVYPFFILTEKSSKIWKRFYFFYWKIDLQLIFSQVHFLKNVLSCYVLFIMCSSRKYPHYGHFCFRPLIAQQMVLNCHTPPPPTL